MNPLCKTASCDSCPKKSVCRGCAETGGSPFGGRCVAAELVKKGGIEALQSFKENLIAEIQQLGIPELMVDELYLLNGGFVNLAYPLPGGECVRFLKDENVYFSSQVERAGGKRCYGVVADDGFLLVGEYGKEGEDPEIVVYRRRRIEKSEK